MIALRRQYWRYSNIEALGLEYYAYMAFGILCHHIWVLGPSGPQGKGDLRRTHGTQGLRGALWYIAGAFNNSGFAFSWPT